MNTCATRPGHKWLVLLAGVWATVVFSINLILLAPILGQVAKDLGVNVGVATNLLTGFVFSGSVIAIIGGIICDRWGLTAALVLSSLCVTVPATLMPWIGHDYQTVLVLRLIQGASLGLGMASTGPILARWFPPEERGLAGGFLIGGMSLGCGIGVILSPAIFLLVGSWQKMSALLSIAGWAGIVLTLAVTRKQPPVISAVNPEPQQMGPEPVSAPLKDLLLSPVTWIATMVIFFAAWGVQSLLNLVPAYLASDVPIGLGLGPMIAGKLSLALTLIGIFANFAGGMFFDKVAKGDARFSFVMGFLLFAIFAYLILSPFVYQSMWLLVICLMFAGFWAMFAGPAGNAYIIMNFPASSAGRMIGWCNGLGMFGGTVGIWLGGMSVARTGNFRTAITLMCIAAVAGLMVGILAKPRRLARG